MSVLLLFPRIISGSKSVLAFLESVSNVRKLDSYTFYGSHWWNKLCQLSLTNLGNELTSPSSLCYTNEFDIDSHICNQIQYATTLCELANLTSRFY